MSAPRRTQLERRTETRQLVLNAATCLFGEKGYADTSLEDIAAACELTIRPIYHYFGNKKKLFAAVTEQLEQDLVDALDNSLQAGGSRLSQAGWQAFLDMSSNRQFRQVVLVDAPNILGRERWANGVVIIKVRELFKAIQPGISERKSELFFRMLIAALAEAALMTAEIDQSQEVMAEVGSVIESILSLMTKP
jgi:AcrR family transcriptional regulator